MFDKSQKVHTQRSTKKLKYKFKQVLDKITIKTGHNLIIKIFI